MDGSVAVNCSRMRLLGGGDDFLSTASEVERESYVSISKIQSQVNHGFRQGFGTRASLVHLWKYIYHVTEPMLGHKLHLES